MDIRDILTVVRGLPYEARAELIATLLRESVRPTELGILHGMSEMELKTLAQAVVAPGHQRRLKLLLRKNKQGLLSEQEQKELDALLEEGDQVALLKAKASYTLTQMHQSTTAAA